MEKVSVGTEGLGLSIAQNGGLRFKLSEIVVGIFHLNVLPVVKTIKQTKRDNV
jgi:hypothetical protein